MGKKGKGQSTEASGQPAQASVTKAVSEVKTQQTPGNKAQVTKQDNKPVQSSKVESVATPVIQTPKVVANEQTTKKPEEVKKEEKAQVFGLYFHNSKVLSTFLFFAIGIIAVPIATYIYSNGYLSKIPEISQSQAQIYSGFLSIGVVGLFLLGYCTFAITDESNFKQEQSQYEALAEQSKSKKDKESKKQPETPVVSEVKEIAQKKPVEVVAQNKQEAPKKQDTKKEKTPESQVASAGAAKQDAGQSKKKEQSGSSVKESTAASTKKEPQGKASAKQQQDNQPKKEQQKQSLEKPQEPSKPTLKSAVQEAEDDSWNEVKVVGKKGKKAGNAVGAAASAGTKSKVEQAEEKVSSSNKVEEEDDGFIIVRQKKTPVVE